MKPEKKIGGLSYDVMSGQPCEMSDPLSCGKYVFGLGSNCGDRVRQVERAIEWLSGLLTDVTVSDIYETPAYGHAGGPYMNAVVKGNYTGKGGIEILERLCKQYEIVNGRNAEARKNNLVPIDIDIVMRDRCILRKADFSRSFFQTGYRQLSEI